MRTVRITLLSTLSAAFLIGSSGVAEASPSEAWALGPTPPDGIAIIVHAERSDPEAHEIDLAYSAGAYLITDSAGITAIVHPSYPPPAEPCTQVDPTTVSCPATPAQLDVINIETGVGRDLVDFRQVSTPFGHVITLEGDDQVFTGDVYGDFYRVDGAGGDDLLRGGRANDHFTAGPGDDIVRTGAGSPVPDLPARFPTNAVTGDAGDDVIFGGSARDWLNGSSGRDYIVGRRGRDQIGGGPGNDTIHSRDGRADGISCGPGNPRRQHAIRDRRDELVWFADWFADPFDRINC